MSPGSIMPQYTWLIQQDLNISTTPKKISVMRSLGVPYENSYENFANDDLMKQAETISDDLLNNGVIIEPQKEIIALIAYLQRLGTDIKVKPQN